MVAVYGGFKCTEAFLMTYMHAWLGRSRGCKQYGISSTMRIYSVPGVLSTCALQANIAPPCGNGVLLEGLLVCQAQGRLAELWSICTSSGDPKLTNVDWAVHFG